MDMGADAAVSRLLEWLARELPRLSEAHDEFKIIVYGYKREGKRLFDIEPIPRVKIDSRSSVAADVLE